MRYTFLIIFFILLQFLSYGAGKWWQWLLKPYVNANMLTVAMIAMFVIGNGLFLMSFLGFFRSISWWLALLWLLMLSSVVTYLIWFAAKNVLTTEILTPSIRLVAVFSYVGLVGFAVFNAYSPTVRHLDIQIDKPLQKPLTIAMASDTHLGALVGNRQLQKLQTLLAQNEVDLLLMPGDIMDDDTTVYDRENIGVLFAEVAKTAKSGAFATLGNHDLYRTAAYHKIHDNIEKAGFELLNDRAIFVEGVWLVGRYDDHAHQRASTAQLLQKVDPKKPIILLDHRPSEIDIHKDLPIDVQVSGHTHKGQVFPANFVVDMMYPLGYGHKKINNTHFIVSSGFGFWGIPLRLGSRAEIWVIRLTSPTYVN